MNTFIRHFKAHYLAISICSVLTLAMVLSSGLIDVSSSSAQQAYTPELKLACQQVTQGVAWRATLCRQFGTDWASLFSSQEQEFQFYQKHFLGVSSASYPSRNNVYSLLQDEKERSYGDSTLWNTQKSYTPEQKLACHQAADGVGWMRTMCTYYGIDWAQLFNTQLEAYRFYQTYLLGVSSTSFPSRNQMINILQDAKRDTSQQVRAVDTTRIAPAPNSYSPELKLKCSEAGYKTWKLAICLRHGVEIQQVFGSDQAAYAFYQRHYATGTKFEYGDAATVASPLYGAAQQGESSTGNPALQSVPENFSLFIPDELRDQEDPSLTAAENEILLLIEKVRKGEFDQQDEDICKASTQEEWQLALCLEFGVGSMDLFESPEEALAFSKEFLLNNQTAPTITRKPSGVVQVNYNSNGEVYSWSMLYKMMATKEPNEIEEVNAIAEEARVEGTMPDPELWFHKYQIWFENKYPQYAGKDPASPVSALLIKEVYGGIPVGVTSELQKFSSQQPSGAPQYRLINKKTQEVVNMAMLYKIAADRTPGAAEQVSGFEADYIRLNPTGDLPWFKGYEAWFHNKYPEFANIEPWAEADSGLVIQYLGEIPEHFESAQRIVATGLRGAAPSQPDEVVEQTIDVESAEFESLFGDEDAEYLYDESGVALNWFRFWEMIKASDIPDSKIQAAKAYNSFADWLQGEYSGYPIPNNVDLVSMNVVREFLGDLIPVGFSTENPQILSLIDDLEGAFAGDDNGEINAEILNEDISELLKPFTEFFEGISEFVGDAIDANAEIQELNELDANEEFQAFLDRIQFDEEAQTIGSGTLSDLDPEDREVVEAFLNEPTFSTVLEKQQQLFEIFSAVAVDELEDSPFAFETLDGVTSQPVAPYSEDEKSLFCSSDEDGEIVDDDPRCF